MQAPYPVTHRGCRSWMVESWPPSSEIRTGVLADGSVSPNQPTSPCHRVVDRRDERSVDEEQRVDRVDGHGMSITTGALTGR